MNLSPLLSQLSAVETERFVWDDGGRAASGRKGMAGDCVTRSVAIAAGISYDEAYGAVADLNAEKGKPRSARKGASKDITRAVMAKYGGEWTPTMGIGTGTRVHLRADELPAGRLVVRLSRHVCAVIDGVVHDTYDPSREGTRAVYGYWTFPERDPA